jgi:hypothetical protein
VAEKQAYREGGVISNKTEKAYSLEYTNNPDAFYAPQQVGSSCTNISVLSVALSLEVNK